MQVLVVEDERRMAELIRRGLEEEGHAVVVAYDGVAAVSLARTHPFDVIVLDVMLPKMDGFEVARQVRGDRNQTPILMLTARDAEQDVVRGLDLGADDYLTKPFSFEVLLARIRAVARRGVVAQPVLLQVQDLCLNPATHEVRRGVRRVFLTRTEFTLLEFLMRRAGTVIPRETLLQVVWGFDSDVQSNTLDAFIRLLRNKIDAGGQPSLIQTVRGIGYSLSGPT